MALGALDAERGERELGLRELEEAAEAARDCGAHGILRGIEQFRSAI